MSDGPLINFGNGMLHGIIEISLPEPVVWDFSAPGWTGVAMIIAAALSHRLWKVWRAWQRNAYRRAAMRELDSWREQPWPSRIRGYPRLLKSVALHAFSRDEVAALSGAPWIGFLRQVAPRARLDDEVAALLLAAAYRPSEHCNIDEQLARRCEQWVRDWIRWHRRAVDV